jgi:hypothetical protein
VSAIMPEDLATEIDTVSSGHDSMTRATNLLALTLAPRMSGARLCHVELLTLHPHQRCMCSSSPLGLC